MASSDPFRFDPEAPPPRPATPVVRRGFLFVLLGLSVAALLVYGVPLVAYRTGYAYEAGRARADSEALAKLDEAGIIQRSSALFRMATSAVSPAVVNVRSYRRAPLGPGGAGADGGPAVAPGAPGGGLMALSSGSGVVIDAKNGFVVTNHHVIDGADQIGVRIGRSGEATARLVGSDKQTDLAVLQVSLPIQVEARWGDSDTMQIGDWVLAIGSPFELDSTVTLGIVSATGRSNLPMVAADAYQDFVQTDAAINPGNSGGPLVNLKGEVIGINTAIYSETGGAQGIGFAISSAMARRVVDQLIASGRVARGYLGVSIQDVDPRRAADLKLPDARGALVMDVQPGSPADRAGLVPGDVVVDLDGRPVDNTASLRTRAFALPIRSKVPLTYVRSGQPTTVEVTIDEMPVLLSLGIVLRELPPEIARRFADQPERALGVVQVAPGTPASLSGVAVGHRLIAVGPVPVETIERAEAEARKFDPDQGVPLQVQTPDGRDLRFLVGARLPDR